MELEVSGNALIVRGNIKSINDFQNIKQRVDAMINESKHININILESLSITSSIIGYFNKLVLKDGIDLHMNIHDEQLFHLLDDLNLVSTFKAKKV